MRKINCPICDLYGNNKVVYQENLPISKELANYSARKTPDNYHYQMVRCNKCGLLYASSIYESDEIKSLYEMSDFGYDHELKNLQKTYRKCLKEIENIIPSKENFLEIGCGNGFLLEEAISLGYKNVIGVDPSSQAINHAKPFIKNKIIHGSFNPNDFINNKFDVIFFAMIIEHVEDVNKFLQGIYSILKPGGIVLGIAHDERSMLSRILKNRCPIINDEHIYVFGQKTLRNIFIKNNFVVKKISKLANLYSIKYWFKMMPLPKRILELILNFLSIIRINNKILKLKAGNIFIVAKK